MQETAEIAPPEAPWCEFARAPLVPAAVAALLGILLDRAFAIPLETGFILAVVGLITSILIPNFARCFIAVAVLGLALAHHHLHRHRFDADDIGRHATAESRIARLRGFVDEVPVIQISSRSEFLGPLHRHDRGHTVLRVTGFEGADGWQPASGRVRLTLERVLTSNEPGYLDAVTLGDEVEVVGLLATPNSPSNPGERDYALHLQDKRIRAELRVAKGAEGVTRLAEGSDWSLDRALATLRGRLTKVITQSLAGTDAALARALLLGDGTATDRDDWDAFARTGVVHVLVISGQHLVVLAGAVWMVLRVVGLPRRYGAAVVMLLVLTYALLTGGQPSAMRAAVMVIVFCGAMLFRRPVNTANAIALAWLILVSLDPAEAVSAGSKLSFISVIVLIFGVGRWLTPRPLTAIEQLQQEARPPWLNALRSIGRTIAAAYIVNFVLTVTNTPLLVHTNNVVPVASLIIGPPVILLTTVALLAGFVQLILGAAWLPLAEPFAYITGSMLHLGRDIVRAAAQIPGGALYVPNVPVTWVVGFYILLFAAVLTLDRRLFVLLALWTAAVLVTGPSKPADELCVTFVSVGHGGCTVIETADGRVLMYDCGTMAGPDTVRRSIAPYLWHRGISRIDELIISHADLDHYGCTPELLKRFHVGQVTLTPSFALKKNAEVAGVLRELDAHHVPRRTVTAGETFTAGPVMLEVLHPPADGPPGIENEWSLVLQITYQSRTILLTGDLEKAGTQYLLNQRPRVLDVMMAPHHGAKAAFPPALTMWSDPGLIVVNRGARTSPNEALSGRNVWDTHTQGAITIRISPGGLVCEAFRSGERMVIPKDR